MTTRRSLTKSPKKKTRIEVTRGNTTVTIYLGRYNKMVRGKTLAYPQFTLVYFEHGVRRRQTFADRAKAEDEAAKVATRIENNERDVLKLKNTDQSSYAHATRMLEPLGIPLHAAIEEYVKAREVLGGTSLLVAANDYVRRHNEKLIERTVEQAVKELLKAKEHDRMSLRYIQTLRTHLNRFAQAFRSPISGVTARDIDGWLRRIAREPRTRNNMRRSVVTLFSFCKTMGYLPKNLATEAEGVSRAKDRGGDIGFFSVDDLSKLLLGGVDADGNEIKPTAESELYVALGAFAGLRAAELLRLEWCDINIERSIITVGKHKAKTATRRIVPIQPNLARWLSRAAERKGKVFVSEKANDRTIAYARSIGVAWPNNALRHSYASYRLAQTQNAAQTALELGNSPQTLFSHYREIVTPEDAKLWFGIEPEQPKNVVKLPAKAGAAGIVGAGS